MTPDMILVTWAITGTIIYAVILGWTNGAILDDKFYPLNTALMLLCGPLTQFVWTGLKVLRGIELLGRGFYALRCAYQEWRRSFG